MLKNAQDKSKLTSKFGTSVCWTPTAEFKPS